MARIRETLPEAALADLTVSLGSPLPALLHRSDLPERTADLLEWVWTEVSCPTGHGGGASSRPTSMARMAS